MIFEAIKTAIETVPALKDKVFPVGVVIDDVDPPIVVYTFGAQTPEMTLSEEVHHYTDEILVDFLAETYDQAHELFRSAETALRAISNSDDGCGEYIFGVMVYSRDTDAFDLDTGLQVRRMRVEVQWCDL